MTKVFVTRRIPESGPALLRANDFDVEVSNFDGVLPREVLLEKVRGVDAILSLLTDRIDGDLMDAAGPQLKAIGQFAVGFDNIDLQAAAKRRIVVTNTPGVLTEATAELAVALIYAVARRIVEADQYMREGRFNGWAPLMLLGTNLVGKVLGLIGLGRIGQAVARRMGHMKILYHDTNRNEQLEHQLDIEYRELDDLLKTADVISLHVPLTDRTRYLIDSTRLGMMKSTAYLINTSRGPVVDEGALVEALKTGRIKGAALDVYEEEPLMAPGLAELTNVVLVPHIGSATEEARSAMSELAAQNIIAVLSGRKPFTPIQGS
jgi:glyoxylate reductase